MTEYEQALQLMDDEHPNTFKVRLLLESATARSDDRAEYALATWYIHGNHAPKDLSKGIELLENAATKGNADAAFDLAVCSSGAKAFQSPRNGHSTSTESQPRRATVKRCTRSAECSIMG